MRRINPYDKRYSESDYYWGGQPSAFCYRLLDFVKPTGKRILNLLDLGCGEGQNAVCFAENGFEVTGLDISSIGLEKAVALAAQRGVQIKTVCDDLVTCEIKLQYDIIFSSGALQYIPPPSRQERIDQIKKATSADGFNAMAVLVNKSFIPRAPDAEEGVTLFESGELMSYYSDWEILYTVEEIFDCCSSGRPHRHAINRIVARRYSDSG